ncbi:MAG: glutamate-5-semialdehyde dehydrogenase [Actinomycetes bacterium]|jgi:glutamate-5-semialdehyde dehydrogenase|nr:glutamate-5-semialdehyde dehydrogenase [Actinomycetes bacterium]
MGRNVTEQARAARVAAVQLAASSLEVRNAALRAMIDALTDDQDAILAANRADIEAARAKGTNEQLIDRLALDEKRLDGIRQALTELIAAPDVLGEVLCGRTITAGIRMKQVRVPMGVVGMIYEARPNVTVDAAGIAIKTGNAILLRGGSLARQSNDAIIDALQSALTDVGLSADCLQAVDASNRDSATAMMEAHGLIDVLIPRGGAGLIRSVVENAKVPVIETGTGNCHVYIHAAADADMAENILVNAKCQRPSVCNAAESLLIDRTIAPELLPRLARALVARDVVLAVDSDSYDLVHDALGDTRHLERATDEDWGREYLDLKISVHQVDGVRSAVEHINRYGTKHSEAIVTADWDAAQYFTANVDASAVYVNASTRFTDGGMFGLGAEIGISTQKLHARGPMGLSALTSTKFILEGSGQVRG